MNGAGDAGAEVVGGPGTADAEPGGESGEASGRAAPGKVHRLRAPRTVAATLVATVVLVAAGALLYDVIAVRAGQPARRWRTQIADELATRHLDDVWVLVGAGVATLLGGWLLWLAIAPGLGRWLVLRPYGGTAAAVDRAGIGHLLTDRAAGLAGIDHLRIRVGRRRVRVSLTGAADPASVQRQLREELDRVGLARPLRLDVRTADRRGAGGGTGTAEGPEDGERPEDSERAENGKGPEDGERGENGKGPEQGDGTGTGPGTGVAG
ncbi:DUF6286 domain-containing protein [Kitasatospora sp. NPDC048545]|uniref:DUF6286 domain-containing protein n=1 Tax=Kitasatospora sp. NPDC048545 TaxID=3157208 RepID=UPI0033D6A01D